MFWLKGEIIKNNNFYKIIKKKKTNNKNQIEKQNVKTFVKMYLDQ